MRMAWPDSTQEEKGKSKNKAAGPPTSRLLVTVLIEADVQRLQPQGFKIEEQEKEGGPKMFSW